MAYRHRGKNGWRLGQWGLVIAMAVCTPYIPTGPGLAQVLRPEIRDPYLANPLNDDPRDPLLPNPPIKRPLSPLELYQLEQDLDELALEAETLAEEGDDTTAAALWMREVRLRRLLGIDQELSAMRRVAQWLRDRGSTQQLQLLSARLAVIEQSLVPDSFGNEPSPSPASAEDESSLDPDFPSGELSPSPTSSEDEPPLDPDFPSEQARPLEIAEIYAILGNVDAATVIYRSLANEALTMGDREAYQTLLEALAGLQAAWFYFVDAAETFEDLVQITQTDPKRDDEIRYLKSQIYNLEQAQSFEAAIEQQKQLIAIYSEDETLWPQIPSLQYDIAKNFTALGEQESAADYLQASYTNAITGLQFSVASQSIRSLAEIYRSLERWQDVLYLYDQLIVVEQQSFNAYGIMDAFDQKGQVYELLGQPEDALAAYREGLVLARHLNHRRDYFEAQIARLTTPGEEPTEPLPEQAPLDSSQGSL